MSLVYEYAVAVAQRAGKGDAADLAAEMVVRTCCDDGAALRRASPGALLDCWLAGVHSRVCLEWQRKLIKERDHVAKERRSERNRREADVRTDEGAETGACTTVGLGDLDLDACTPRQREALRLFLKGTPKSRIAAALGVDRKSVAERIVRGLRRVRAGRAAEASPASRAVRALEDSGNRLSGVERSFLRLYGPGATHRVVGGHLCISREGARKRYQRLMAKLRSART